MSGDDKPSRFAMISEEMLNPPELKPPSNQIISEVIVTGTSTRVLTGSKATFLFNGEVVGFASGVSSLEEMINPPELAKVEVSLDPGSLTWNGEATVCPRCKLGAFELMSALTKQVTILCLGCPPPAPTYFIPEGSKVNVNPYRCCRCGNRARVTMTLSAVNLHCRACNQLTLHIRQDPAPKKSTAFTSWILDRKQKPKPGMWSNSTLGVPYQEPELAAAFIGSYEAERRDVDKLVERMRVALKLENFFDYAQKRRLLNAKLVVQGAYDGNDIARGTGRTTRGILDTVAECNYSQKEGMIIQAGSARAEGHAYRFAQELISQLRTPYPVWIKRKSDLGLRQSLDAITYVDHTYNGR